MIAGALADVGRVGRIARGSVAVFVLAAFLVVVMASPAWASSTDWLATANGGGVNSSSFTNPGLAQDSDSSTSAYYSTYGSFCNAYGDAFAPIHRAATATTRTIAQLHIKLTVPCVGSGGTNNSRIDISCGSGGYAATLSVPLTSVNFDGDIDLVAMSGYGTCYTAVVDVRFWAGGNGANFSLFDMRGYDAAQSTITTSPGAGGAGLRWVTLRAGVWTDSTHRLGDLWMEVAGIPSCDLIVQHEDVDYPNQYLPENVGVLLLGDTSGAVHVAPVTLAAGSGWYVFTCSSDGRYTSRRLFIGTIVATGTPVPTPSPQPPGTISGGVENCGQLDVACAGRNIVAGILGGVGGAISAAFLPTTSLGTWMDARIAGLTSREPFATVGAAKDTITAWSTKATTTAGNCALSWDAHLIPGNPTAVQHIAICFGVVTSQTNWSTVRGLMGVWVYGKFALWAWSWFRSSIEPKQMELGL